METNKKEVLFLVQGSEPDPYKVTFSKNGDNLRGLCNCKAAKNGMACKHRLDVLQNNKKAIIALQLDLDDVKLVQTWLIGSDVERCMIELQDAEETAKEYQEAVKEAKRNLNHALVD